MTAKRRITALALLGLVAAAAWARRERSNPSACPYSQRFVLDLPRPFMRRETLGELLSPAPGERVLEVGPGTGYYTLAIAPRLRPGGQLDALDLQQPMLDELTRRANERGIHNVAPAQGDAQRLPYANDTFDAAYLVATLGEIPDKDQALRELRRVLKPDGRLIVGEGQPDPHLITSDGLRQRAAEAGLRLERMAGGRFGYFALLQPV